MSSLSLKRTPGSSEKDGEETLPMASSRNVPSIKSPSAASDRRDSCPRNCSSGFRGRPVRLNSSDWVRRPTVSDVAACLPDSTDLRSGQAVLICRTSRSGALEDCSASATGDARARKIALCLASKSGQGVTARGCLSRCRSPSERRFLRSAMVGSGRRMPLRSGFRCRPRDVGGRQNQGECHDGSNSAMCVSGVRSRG